jgi:hypothetical protein
MIKNFITLYILIFSFKVCASEMLSFAEIFSSLLKAENNILLKACRQEQQTSFSQRKLLLFLKKMNCQDMYNYYKKANYLTITGANLTDTSLLASMPNLKFITFKNSTIKNLKGLYGHEKLKIIFLKSTQIEKKYLDEFIKKQSSVRVYL